MKKLMTAMLIAMTTLSSVNANVNLDGIVSNLNGLYGALGGDVSTDYTGSGQVFGTEGYIAGVNQEANGFIDAFRAASGGLDFDASAWTLSNTSTGVGALETARDGLRSAETALVNKVQSDLVGDGTVANSWGVAVLAAARIDGGLVGRLTADIQEDTRDLSGAVASVDVQTLYETDGALVSFFRVTNAASQDLVDNVNRTRDAVAKARDGFSNTGGVIGRNTGSIVIDSSDMSLTASVLTNSASDHIQVSDYFTAAAEVTSLSLDAITDNFTDDAGIVAYKFNSKGYSNFTNFVLGISSDNVFAGPNGEEVITLATHIIKEVATGQFKIFYVAADGTETNISGSVGVNIQPDDSYLDNFSNSYASLQAYIDFKLL